MKNFGMGLIVAALVHMWFNHYSTWTFDDQTRKCIDENQMLSKAISVYQKLPYKIIQYEGKYFKAFELGPPLISEDKSK